MHVAIRIILHMHITIAIKIFLKNIMQLYIIIDIHMLQLFHDCNPILTWPKCIHMVDSTIANVISLIEIFF